LLHSRVERIADVGLEPTTCGLEDRRSRSTELIGCILKFKTRREMRSCACPMSVSERILATENPERHRETETDSNYHLFSVNSVSSVAKRFSRWRAHWAGTRACPSCIRFCVLNFLNEKRVKWLEPVSDRPENNSGFSISDFGFVRDFQIANRESKIENPKRLSFVLQTRP
jgi:hypothetical protein